VADAFPPLLVHRCFITSDKPHHDLWPYDETLRLSGTEFA